MCPIDVIRMCSSYMSSTNIITITLRTNFFSSQFTFKIRNLSPDAWWFHSTLFNYGIWISKMSGYGAYRHFQQYFSYIVAVSFIDEGNRSTRTKQPTCCKSLTNFITWCCIKYTSPWTGFEITTLVAIGKDCTSNCKSNYHKIKTTMAPSDKCIRNRLNQNGIYTVIEMSFSLFCVDQESKLVDFIAHCLTIGMWISIICNLVKKYWRR